MKSRMVSDIGHLAASVSLNIDPFQRSIKTLEAQQKALKATLKASDAAFLGTGNSAKNLGSKYAILTAQTKTQQAIVQRLKQDYETKANVVKNSSNATEMEIKAAIKAERAYKLAEATLSTYNRSLQKTEGQLRIQNSAFYRAGSQIEAYGKKLQTGSQKVIDTGKRMSMAVSMPVGVALGIATNAAVSFSSEIQKMSSLLDDGHVSASDLQKQLEKLGDASKSWSMKYGVSTNEINNGMEEVIKKGYTYEQTLGAMPSIMDATVASGDEFNDVMHVSTSVLEQFGLKTEDTAGTLKNTQRVTDSLTFVANKTAAGFSDIGLAMEYVGPVSHSLNMSLEETSSAIGLMSNNGIEGEKAGTSLRGALSKLLKPSKQNIEGFNKLGISVKDFQNGTLDLPTILDKIKNNTKGWNDEQRSSAIALAFGTEAQTGMNVLVAQGGDALRNLTKETKNSTGYTQKLVESQGNTPQKKVQKFKESLHVLAITVGEKLLPVVTPLIDKGTDLVNKFASMDSGTQHNILHMALLAAAIGPVASIIGSVGRVTGSVTSGVGILTKGIGLLSGGSIKTKSSLSTLENGLGSVVNGAGSAEGAVGLFGAALNPVGLAVVGVGATLALGWGAWELWGKKAYESSKRTQRWGTDVGEAADKSLTKFEGFSTDAKSAVDLFANGATGDADKIKKAFQSMANEITSNTDKAFKDLENTYNNESPAIQKILEDDYNNAKAKSKKIKDDVGAQTKTINDIYSNAAKNHRYLSSDESKMVNNIYRAMQREEIESLNISGKKKRQLLQTMNGDVEGLNKNALTEQNNYFAKSTQAVIKSFDKRKANIKKQYENDEISQKARDDALTALEKERNDKAFASASAWVRVQRKLYEENGTDSATAEQNIKRGLEDMGLSYDKYTEKALAASKKVNEANKFISDGVSKADLAWNGLILDPKTGKVRTNLPQFIKDATKTKEGWDNLQFIIKNAQLTTDAKKMIATALVENGKWNQLDFKEQDALLTTNSQQQMHRVMVDNGTWNNLSYDEQKALLNTNSSATAVKFMKTYGIWQGLTPKEKNLVLNTTAYKATEDLINAIKEWDKIKPRDQKILTLSYRTNGKAPSGMQQMNAVGTNDFRGGLTILGDGAKREPFLTPGGYFGISPNTPTAPLALPKGTKIWSSMARFNAHKIFAKSRLSNVISQLTPQLNSPSFLSNTIPGQTNVMDKDAVSERHIAVLEENNKKQDTIIAKLAKLVEKNVTLDLDKLEKSTSERGAKRAMRDAYAEGRAYDW